MTEQDEVEVLIDQIDAVLRMGGWPESMTQTLPQIRQKLERYADLLYGGANDC